MAAIETTATVVDITDATPQGRKCKTAAEAKAYKEKRGKSFSGNNGRTGRGRGTGEGKPRAFRNGDELIDAQRNYCRYIADTGYQEYPTKNGFSDYIGVDPKTVWLSIERYYPEIKQQWKENIEQTLINGVNAGVYHVTMTIFILKNWCDWRDRKETIDSTAKPQIATKAELQEAITAYLQAPVNE